MIGAQARALETSGGFNATLANLVLHNIPPDEASRYADRLESVDAATANEVARRYISADRATLIVVGDASQFLGDLRELRENIEVIPGDLLDLSSPTLRRIVQPEEGLATAE